MKPIVIVPKYRNFTAGINTISPIISISSHCPSHFSIHVRTVQSPRITPHQSHTKQYHPSHPTSAEPHISMSSEKKTNSKLCSHYLTVPGYENRNVGTKISEPRTHNSSLCAVIKIYKTPQTTEKKKKKKKEKRKR